MVRLWRAFSSVLILGIALSSCTNHTYHRSNDTNNNSGNGSDNTETGGTTSLVVSTPLVSPGTGSIEYNTEITITCATAGASIYYNTGNGSQDDPNQSTGTLYNPQHKPIVTPPIMIKTKAFKAGYQASQTVLVSYSFGKILVAGDFTGYNDINRNDGS